MPLCQREPSLTLLVSPIGTFDHQTETEDQAGHLRKTNDGPSTVSGHVPVLLEVRVNWPPYLLPLNFPQSLEGGVHALQPLLPLPLLLLLLPLHYRRT
jgi:hypothetical protein